MFAHGRLRTSFRRVVDKLSRLPANVVRGTVAQVHGLALIPDALRCGLRKASGSSLPLVTAALIALACLGAVGVRTIAAKMWRLPHVTPVTGAIIARDMCLTVSVGASAAYECGDLRVVHALPTVTVLNTPRTPILTYNSQHAHPKPVVADTITISTPLPDSVKAVWTVDGVTRATKVWHTETHWGASGGTRRITLSFDAIELYTDVYTSQLDISVKNGGVWSSHSSNSGRIAIVNRTYTPYGIGWWPGGHDQIVFSSPSILLVGGDGSTREYEFATTSGSDSAFVAAALTRPDTLVKHSDGTLTRKLAGGGTAGYDATGFHTITTNKLGHVTTFVKGIGSTYRVNQIEMPHGTRYNFDWDDWKLTGIRVRGDPLTGPERVVSIVITPGSLLTEIFDPGDSNAVTFSYSDNLMVSRTDRRGQVNTFEYDSVGRMIEARGLASAGDTIRHSFCPAEVAGVGSCYSTPVDTANVTTEYKTPRRDVPHTWKFKINRFGFPWKTTNPKGHVTSVTFQPTTFPGLPWVVTHANGGTVETNYDARGNIASVEDRRFTPDTATTTYTWNQTWDELTEIVKPEGEVITFGGFSGSQTKPLWREDGRGSSSRVTFRYTTGSSPGLLRAVEYPNGGHDSLTFDGNGNLNGVGVLRASGKRAWTLTERDEWGRPIVTKSQFDTLWTLGPAHGSQLYRHDSTYYNDMGQVSRTVKYGQSYNGVGSQKAYVDYGYDAEDNLVSLAHQFVDAGDEVGEVEQEWTYDWIGRKITETDALGATETFTYDKAGNVVSHLTRRNKLIEMQYDTLNRLAARMTPPAKYAREHKGLGASPNAKYPRVTAGFTSVTSDSVTIPGDTARFKYDVMGNLIEATNRYSKVLREYALSGLLTEEELWIRKYDLSLPMDSAHKYVSTYKHDMNGRRDSLELPVQLRATASPNFIRYSYDVDGNGALETVTDQLGHAFTYNYNGSNLLTSIDLPSGLKQSLRYALDGSLEADSLTNGSTVLRLTDFSFDAGGRLLMSAARDISNGPTPLDTTAARYTALGHLREREYVAHTLNAQDDDIRFFSADTSLFDALGRLLESVTVLQTQNITTSSNPSYFRYLADVELKPSSGRMRYQHQWVDENGAGHQKRDTLVYNASGDVEFLTRATGLGGEVNPEDRASYYDSEGRLRFADFRRVVNYSGETELDPIQHTYVFEEFRYDALGRRVLVLADRNCAPVHAQADCGLGMIRRTVWDGSIELGEIQMPDTPTYRESDAEFHPNLTLVSGQKDPHSLFGRAIYTNGAGIDRPLTVTRVAYGEKVGSTHWGFLPFTIVPYWNTRGVAESGGFGNGAQTHCQTISGSNRCVKIEWPGDRFSDRQGKPVPEFWHGNVLNRNEDGGGTLYKRNRYYDTRTGQFTQEDPIGVAGGLNLYGFAGGDPVNMSDPFGTNPILLWIAGALWGAFEAGSIAMDVKNAASSWLDADDSIGEKLGNTGWAVAGGVLPASGGAWRRGLEAGIEKAVAKAQGADIKWTQLGDFLRGVHEVPGEKGAGYVRWNRVLDADGATVRLFKDVFDQGADFLRRDWYVGGPLR